jgi:hypothetical protein
MPRESVPWQTYLDAGRLDLGSLVVCTVLQVVWVDLLTRREFEQGFGSHTPIFSGQTKCVRYYMNFDRALALHKAVLLKVCQGRMCCSTHHAFYSPFYCSGQ